MPENDALAIAALDALGFAIFVREKSGALRLAGNAPAWLRNIWPGVTEDGVELPVSEVSPFLENFLIDADAVWRSGERRTRSGPWIERDATGAEVQLEAIALTAAGEPLLLIERLGEEFEAKKLVLQKARENVIEHHRLNSELQKKEILLHCVAENMTAALANAITAVRLMELEQDPVKTHILIGLASRAMEDQQGLIHKVLDVFAGDLDGLYGRQGNTPAYADLRAVTRAAADEVASQFSEKGVRLTASGVSGGELPITADAAHMQSVAANLLENALLNVPFGGEVLMRLEDEAEFATLRIEDGGETIEGSVSAELFASTAPPDAGPGTSRLRLYFCRIAVENCGGDIGCEARAGGGNCFWIRLPKAHRAV